MNMVHFYSIEQQTWNKVNTKSACIWWRGSEAWSNAQDSRSSGIFDFKGIAYESSRPLGVRGFESHSLHHQSIKWLWKLIVYNACRIMHKPKTNLKNIVSIRYALSEFRVYNLLTQRTSRWIFLTIKQLSYENYFCILMYRSVVSRSTIVKRHLSAPKPLAKSNLISISQNLSQPN